MLRINEIKLSLDSDESELLTLAAKALRCPERKITGIEIVKKAIDSRKKDDIYFVYNINVTLDGDENTVLKKCRNSKVEEGREIRDNERISNKLRRGKTVDEIVDFCGYPKEQVEKIEKEMTISVE